MVINTTALPSKDCTIAGFAKLYGQPTLALLYQHMLSDGRNKTHHFILSITKNRLTEQNKFRSHGKEKGGYFAVYYFNMHLPYAA